MLRSATLGVGMSEALEVLVRAWRDAAPASPGPLLVDGARAHPDAWEEPPGPVTAVQPLRQHALDLLGQGVAVVPEVPSGQTWAHAWVLADRQQQVARAALARAVRATAPGGTVWVCAPVREGGKRHAATLEALIGEAQGLARRHCRLAWGRRPEDVDAASLAALEAEDAPRDVDGLRARPGLFSWDRVDPGSRLLSRELPEGLGGVVVDLGAGSGFLTLALLRRCRSVTTVHLVEDDARALAMAEVNLARHAPRADARLHWADVTRELPVTGADVVITNPPFHVGARTAHDVGRAFLQRAAAMLAPHGELWAVANVHLPYELALAEAFARSRVVVERGGYKILRASAPRPVRAR